MRVTSGPFFSLVVQRVEAYDIKYETTNLELAGYPVVPSNNFKCQGEISDLPLRSTT